MYECLVAAYYLPNILATNRSVNPDGVMLVSDGMFLVSRERRHYSAVQYSSAVLQHRLAPNHWTCCLAQGVELYIVL